MSLAARCPSCATVFRVVHDQLRVSDGWVRCGRCSEVFNAIETLVDLDAESVYARASGPAPLAPNAASPSAARVMDDLARLTSADASVDALDRPPPAQGPEPEPALGQDRDLEPASDAAAWSAAAPPIAQPEPPVPARRSSTPDDAAPRSDTGPTPAFLRQAERAERWRRPQVRLALAGAALVAGAALLAQVALVYRDLAAARWPALRPALVQACAVAGCDVQPPRAIELLAVDSSGLVRVDGTALYRLSVVLRSRAAWALAVPSLDLTLTDTQGRVISRRVVSLAELGVAADAVPAASELSLQTTISSAERVISGYTIELFYP